LRILWLLDIDARYGIRHGATLRYANLSRGLGAAGHRVYYVLNNYRRPERELQQEYLASLRKDGCFRDYFELDLPPHSRTRARFGSLFVHPQVRNWLLCSSRKEYSRRFRELVEKLRPDVLILSDRTSLFLLSEWSGRLSTIIDWGDSFALHWMRDLQSAFRERRLARLPRDLNFLVRCGAEEAFYGRLADVNLLVSAADRKFMDTLNRLPERNKVIANGVAMPGVSVPPPKEANSLIFTGSMSYPPNHRAALWLIEKVFPLLVQRNPQVRLAIAGQEPSAALRAKAGPGIEVTGLVPNLGERIAQSQVYVAPLTSGSGFRNKIAEALANGTFVIGTPMAFDFLDDRLRAQLLTATTAEDFAQKILKFFEKPSIFDQRLETAMGIIKNEYSWDIRAKQLEALCSSIARGPVAEQA
jgi:glycosyltransferase involved in cell wall biosynthesis